MKIAKGTPSECKTCTCFKESIFCDALSSNLEAIESGKTTNCYKARQVVFYEGNQPHGLYCIKSGKVKIYKRDGEGHHQIVRLAGPGELLGYRCILGEENYTATAETIEETVLCFFDKKTFLTLLETHPAISLRMMHILADDLRSAENRMANMVHKNIRERLAELFLVFRKKYGEVTPKGIKLNISLTREELAEFVGTTQESVIRLITEFKQSGLIEVQGRAITLTDLPRLTETANLMD